MAQHTFKCHICNFSAPYEKYGRELQVSEELEKHETLFQAPSRIVFLEDTYLVSDPYCAQRRAVALGSNCAACGLMVCCSTECGLFYAKRFCADCCRLEPNRSAFPPQLIKLAPQLFGQVSS